jgi:hypothetical protein
MSSDHNLIVSRSQRGRCVSSRAFSSYVALGAEGLVAFAEPDQLTHDQRPDERDPDEDRGFGLGIE